MKRVELTDICKYKFLSQLQYAPDGKSAAFVVSYANENANTYEGNIYLYENGKVRKLTGMNKERSFFFEDGENILFAAARTDAEKEAAKSGKNITTNYYRINIHGGEAQKAFSLPYAGSIAKRIDATHLIINGSIDANNPDYYKLSQKERAKIDAQKEADKDYEVFDEWPFWSNGGGVTNKNRNALFIYDTAADKSVRITDAFVNASACFVRDNAIYYMAAEYKQVEPLAYELFKYDIKSGKTKKLFGEKNFSLSMALDYSGKTIVVGSDGKLMGLNQNGRMYVLDEKKGTLELFYDLDDSMYNSVGGDCSLGGGYSVKCTDKIYSVLTRRNMSGIYSFADDAKDVPVYTEEGAVVCFDVHKDNAELLFVAFRAQKLQELYSLKNGKVKQLTHFNDAILKGRYVAKPEKLVIESEGWDIDGWVLKPIDFDPKKKYPAIFEIHGGPKTVYGEIFHHEMQYFASAGYFVFFCNPVGGDGRGDKFADIRGHYGETDYKNLMDFCDAVLKKYPQIDKKRVGETGGSYGGFMTNWIVGHTDRFACAATQRSISNWVSFYGVSDIGPYFAMDQTAGNLEDKVDVFWKQSPLKYAGNVKTPLLFIHSDEDYRCPLEQGIQFYTALKYRGVETRMCLFHGENHDLSRSGKPKHRIRRLSEISNWMDKYLKK